MARVATTSGAREDGRRGSSLHFSIVAGGRGGTRRADRARVSMIRWRGGLALLCVMSAVGCASAPEPRAITIDASRADGTPWTILPRRQSIAIIGLEHTYLIDTTGLDAVATVIAADGTVAPEISGDDFDELAGLVEDVLAQDDLRADAAVQPSTGLDCSAKQNAIRVAVVATAAFFSVRAWRQWGSTATASLRDANRTANAFTRFLNTYWGGPAGTLVVSAVVAARSFAHDLLMCAEAAALDHLGG